MAYASPHLLTRAEVNEAHVGRAGTISRPVRPQRGAPVIMGVVGDVEAGAAAHQLTSARKWVGKWKRKWERVRHFQRIRLRRSGR